MAYGECSFDSFSISLTACATTNKTSTTEPIISGIGIGVGVGVGVGVVVVVHLM
jgi:hypothetical protein